jgi:uncharacterized protein YbaA (DUF1428 family)
MAYVDGFVIPVPKKRRADYIKLAKLGRKIWMEYGALDYHECVGDNLKRGKVTSFPRSVKAKPGEEVWFSWIVYKSRRDRDRIMKKIFADPRMQMDPKKMPFDGKRMFWGGFKPMVSA